MTFSFHRSNEYVPLSPPSDDLTSPVADAELASKSDVLPRLDMDLMGDLQEVINRQCSLVDKSENPSSPPVFRSVSAKHTFFHCLNNKLFFLLCRFQCMLLLNNMYEFFVNVYVVLL